MSETAQFNPFLCVCVPFSYTGNTRLAVHVEETDQGCNAVNHVASGC